MSQDGSASSRRYRSPATPSCRAFDAVDIGIELRDVNLIAGKHAGQLRRLHRSCEEGFGRLIERFVAEPGPVLDLQFETTNGAQPRNRRRREYSDERFLNTPGIFLVELQRDRVAAQFSRCAVPKTVSASQKRFRHWTSW